MIILFLLNVNSFLKRKNLLEYCLGGDTMVEKAATKETGSKEPCKVELPSGVDAKDIITSFSDSKRLTILELLSEKEMTISQLGEELACSPQNAYHHVKKLLDSGLLKLNRVEVDKNYVEKYYTTAFDEDICFGCMLNEIRKTVQVSPEDKGKIRIALLGSIMAKINKSIKNIEEQIEAGTVEVTDDPSKYSVAVSSCVISSSKIDEFLEKFNEVLWPYLEELKKESKDEEGPKHTFITVLMPGKQG